MKRLIAFMLLPLVLLFLSACSSVSIEDYRHSEPQLNLEDYFIGQTRAWGIFQDRSGQVQRQFTVDIHGYMDGDELVLDEDFLYSDGEVDKRIWRLRRIDEHTYEGRADDVIGVAKGHLEGNAFNFSYILDLPYRDGTIKVKFDDWMFLQPDGVMINRAVMSKFGIRLGEVTLVFQRTE